jgi:glycosyltransferase involved in cell wall biosynthesis
MNPRVSIVMPAYNYGRYLAGAVQSVLAQTFADWELLIVDDGSTDHTADVVRPFLADPRVRYLPQANQGPAVARNNGIAQARGQFVAFLDADDRWLPPKLERQLALIEKRLAVGLVYAPRRVIDPEGREREYRQPAMYRGRVLAELFRDNFVCFSSVLVRREALSRAGGFDTKVAHSEDWELLLRLAAEWEFDYVDEPLVLYRTGHGNLSSQTDKRYRAVCAIMRRFLATVQLPRPLVRRAWAETYSHWAYVSRERSPGRAAALLARALWHRPHHLEAWRGFAGLALSRFKLPILPS